MEPLKIVISGYGRMGKEVEKAALSAGHTIIAKIDNKHDWEKFIQSNQKADVVIDFSMPSVAMDVFSKCFNLGIPLVTGTTGWYDYKEKVFSLCHKKEAAFFYAPNFSIGVNLFFYTNRKLASIMNRVKGYRVSISETHHIHKIDKPSGTAIQTANDIISQSNNLNGWQLSGNPPPDKIPIESLREGEVTGTHQVVWKSDADEIELKHKAFNRTGFAQGAVMAAEYIQGKKGIFTMNDLLNLND
jgi:4-hydroxy-tetrahydrodipicolinate reductase